MRAGRLKLTSRPPPAAAPALRKVRRDRVCTAVEINSPNGFPQQDHTRYGGVGPTLHPTGEKGDQFGACTRGPPQSRFRPSVGPETSRPPRVLSMLAMNWRIEPGNESVRPFLPNGSVNQNTGPWALSITFSLMSTTRSTPLNTERGSSNVTPAIVPAPVDWSHCSPCARAPLGVTS